MTKGWNYPKDQKYIPLILGVNMDRNERLIKMTMTCARYIIEQGQRLVADGLGTDWDPNSSELPAIGDNNHGFLDEIPMEDFPLWNWTNAMLQFVRFLTAVVAREVREIDSLDDISEITESINPSEI